VAKQNFEREKVQVQYKVDFAFTEDKNATKPFKADVDKLIPKLKDADEWAFTAALKNGKVERIKSITYPQTHNGHQGEDGHDWQWQLDVKTMGSGSKTRLYLDDVKATIESQKENGTVKVGTAQFTVIECKVKLAGKFSAGQKH
jgi:hypothetical protein